MNRQQVYCLIRKRYVALTPEEEVRQHTVFLLNNNFHYPLTRFSLEAQISLGQLTRRYDIVIYDKDRKPFMLVECKAPSVTVNEKTVQQATAYNIVLKAKYILLTNGKTTILLRNTSKGYVQQKTIPAIK
ncbi:MAG: type I restriction enzyme HsdR N-terminal domain-containing protein [Bacteroidales bacterium]|nr:type I restriction enzyme HsdR N-terminal domain-containing protein [Bacteroidales bacterium]